MNGLTQMIKDLPYLRKLIAAQVLHQAARPQPTFTPATKPAVG